jgi:hypothetical protein
MSTCVDLVEGNDSMNSYGHLYIIQGNIKKIACDAWLLPTDRNFSITESFYDAVGMKSKGPLIWNKRLWSEPWGSNHFILLSPATDAQDPDLWIGRIGGNEDTRVSRFAERAEEFVNLAAQKVHERMTDGKRAPLIAVNVLGSGQGGMRNKRGELLRELIPALVKSARANKCDVVLVTHGSLMYSAANSVRRSLVDTDVDPWREMPEELIDESDRLVALARRSELVVFLGAGVSRDAGLPAWKELLQDVARDLGIEEKEFDEMASLDPRDQATLLGSGREVEFKKAVSERLSSERFSLLHGLLASLPVNEFVTTNFDNLFELAATRSDGPPPVIPGGVVSAGKRWLLKLHGTIGKDLVLTRSEYLGAISSHAALRGLVQAMLLTRHMLFVGYSLSDEDFHQLVHEVRESVGGDESTSFGTVMLLQDRQYLSKLWPDLSFVSTNVGGSNESNVYQSARNLSIMLDYIGANSASDVTFVVDESYGKMKSDHELRLAEILEDLDNLVTEMDHENGNSFNWKPVRNFLDAFKDHE